MGKERYMMVSLDDSRMKSLSEVLGNKTCKKIINYLAENEEASHKDLSDALKIPMNTMDYNMKKLVKSGLVQKRKNFFWSKKGRKIVMYELSNKSIVISPKKSIGQKFKGLLPAFMLTLVGTFAIWVYEKIRGAKSSYDSVNSLVAERFVEKSTVVMEKSGEVLSDGVSQVSNVLGSSPGPLWMWFFGGAILVLFVVSIVNWRKL